MANPEYAELRGSLDGQDPFMTGGHQIIKTRRGNRVTPDWAKNQKKVQQMLLRSFPKLRTDPKQRARAARWALVIQLYFRVHMTEGQVAAQMKLSTNVVKMTINRIKRASKGLKANNKGPLSKAQPGRPKRISDPHQTPLGNPNLPQGRP